MRFSHVVIVLLVLSCPQLALADAFSIDRLTIPRALFSTPNQYETTVLTSGDAPAVPIVTDPASWIITAQAKDGKPFVVPLTKPGGQNAPVTWQGKRAT